MSVNAAPSIQCVYDRNQDSIRKTTAGLLKLVYPRRDAESVRPDELRACLDLAIESRHRVLDQLTRMTPAEFAGDPLKDQITLNI